MILKLLDFLEHHLKFFRFLRFNFPKEYPFCLCRIHYSKNCHWHSFIIWTKYVGFCFWLPSSFLGIVFKLRSTSQAQGSLCLDLRGRKQAYIAFEMDDCHQIVSLSSFLLLQSLLKCWNVYIYTFWWYAY